MKTAKLCRSLSLVCGALALAGGVAWLAEDSAQAQAKIRRLNGTRWELVSTGWKVASDRPVKVPFVEFKDGRVSASAGCNGMGGEYLAENNGTLKIKDLMQTMMSCGPELDKLEGKYSEALLAATKWELSKDRRQLTFIGPKQTLVFERVPMPAQPPVVNVSPDTPVSSRPVQN